RPDFAVTYQASSSFPGSQYGKTLRVPSGVFDQFSWVEQISTNGPSPFTSGESHQMAPWSSQPPPATMMFSPVALARVSNIDKADVTNLAELSFSWTLAADGAFGTSVTTAMAWSRTNQEDALWSTLRPAVRSDQARFPALPAELAAYAPKAGDKLAASNVAH